MAKSERRAIHVGRTVENLMCQRAGRRENDFAISIYRFIDAVGIIRRFQSWPTPLLQLGGVPLDPPEDSSMVHRQPTLLHELFHIPIAQGIAEVPTDAEQNHVTFKMPPFEWGWGAHRNLQ
jgi:hypothetical protein